MVDRSLNPVAHLTLRGLVDTGADLTMIMGGAPGQLGLVEINRVGIIGARGAFDQGHESQCAEFLAQLEIAGREFKWRVVEGGFSEPQMLIGRDVLEHFHLEYDGPGKRFRLR